MRCYRCHKPISKAWAVIEGQVYGPDCATKILVVNTNKKVSNSRVKWYLPSEQQKKDDDTLPLFEEGEML